MRIESTANGRVKGVRRLHRGKERRRIGRTILEGPTLVSAALDAGVVPLEVYTMSGGPMVDRSRDAGAEIVSVNAAVLAALATTVHPQDPVGVVAIPASGPIDDNRVVVLVDISDPGNMGTLVRSAAAFGWQVAVFGGVDPWSPKVVRAGAGAHFARPLVMLDDLTVIGEQGLAMIACIVSGGQPPELFAHETALALLVGSEAHGLPVEVIAACDGAATIPMPGGFESLNAATAGTIAMYLLGPGVNGRSESQDL